MIVNGLGKVPRRLITNDTVLPVDAEVQSLTLWAWSLVDLRTGRRRVRAVTMSGGSGVMVRT